MSLLPTTPIVPAPIKPPSPTAQPAAGALARQKADLKQAADKTNTTLNVDGFVQDSTRAGSLLYKGASSGARGLRVVADLANGEKEAVDRVVSKSASSLRVAAPALKGAGKAFRVFSQWAQVLGVPFAALDVYHAVKAKGDAKNPEIANATFSVLGTGAGIAGFFLFATPAGLPLLLLSSATAGTQLLDTFVTHGKIMDALGHHVIAPIRSLFQGGR